MRLKLSLLLLGSALAGCQHTPQDLADRGLETVNQPVLARATYMFDVAAPEGILVPSEAARLDAWFRSLDLGYGDAVYVDGDVSGAARADIERIAGAYGMMVAPGAPVTAGSLVPGTVRVVVSRTVATVPNCPNWSVPAQPNYNNRTMSNYGCAVESNLAAMAANPADLIHGRDGSSVVDAMTASKAVGLYRSQTPTGAKGLQDVNTKKGN